MEKKKFIRQDSWRYSRLGKNRKKLQKWRQPKGRHRKIREKRFSYPSWPMVGYKSPRKETGRIKGKIPCIVYNIRDLDKANKESIIIIGKVGAKKKLEIIKKANEKKMQIFNIVGGNTDAIK
mgnify:CR=1 FL=1